MEKVKTETLLLRIEYEKNVSVTSLVGLLDNLDKLYSLLSRVKESQPTTLKIQRVSEGSLLIDLIGSTYVMSYFVGVLSSISATHLLNHSRPIMYGIKDQKKLLKHRIKSRIRSKARINGSDLNEATEYTSQILEKVKDTDFKSVIINYQKGDETIKINLKK